MHAQYNTKYRKRKEDGEGKRREGRGRGSTYHLEYTNHLIEKTYAQIQERSTKTEHAEYGPVGHNSQIFLSGITQLILSWF